MTAGSAWWGVDHACGGETRVYPTLHWLGEGPKDPVRAHRTMRRVLVCDSCGDRVVAPDPHYTAAILTTERLDRMAQGYFG